MTNIQDLVERFSISEKSVRRRLDSLSTVLDRHTTTGQKNAILLDNAGLAIFDRLIQLEKQDRLSPSAAAQKVISEVQNGESETGNQNGNTGQTTDQADEAVVEILTQQIKDLRDERDRLLDIIESQGESIKALMPAKNSNEEDGNSSETNGKKKASRLRALSYALFGK